MSFTKEFSREKVNACKLLEGATASHAGSLGRPGKEGLGKARSTGRRAQSAKRGHLRSLDHEHRSSQDISGQWGHTAPQGHRNRATLHNLPPRRQAPALHSPCSARELPCGDRPPGNPGGKPGRRGPGTVMPGTGSWGLRAGWRRWGGLGAGRGSRDAAVREQGRGAESRNGTAA